MCYRMRIPKGEAHLPAIRPRYLEERIDTLGSCKEREMLLAAYRRRRGMAITDISVEMRRPRTTIRGWLAHAMERGPDDLSDRKAPGRRTLLDELSRWWLSELLGRGPRGVRIPGRILAVRDHPGADPQGVWYIVQPAHVTEDTAQDQVLVQEAQTRPVQFRPGGRARGVQEAHICRSGQTDRARICRIQRGRGAPAAVRGGRLRMVSHQRKRDSPDGILNSVRQDVRDPGKGRTPRADSRSHELAHICGLSKVGAPEISKIRARLGQRLVPQVGNGHDYLAYVNGDIRLVFLPPYTPQLNPTEILWREIKRPLSCRYFESEEDLERAIMEIVGGGELKDVKTMDYLAA